VHQFAVAELSGLAERPDLRRAMQHGLAVEADDADVGLVRPWLSTRSLTAAIVRVSAPPRPRGISPVRPGEIPHPRLA